MFLHSCDHGFVCLQIRNIVYGLRKEMEKWKIGKTKIPTFIGYEVAAAKISFMKYIFSLGPLTKNSSSEIKHMGLCLFISQRVL